MRYLPQTTHLSTELIFSSVIPYRLHGGSFVSGSASDAALDGSELAAKGNMIVITVQYRLGALGFIRAPELGIQGNMGVLDAVEALSE